MLASRDSEGWTAGQAAHAASLCRAFAAGRRKDYKKLATPEVARLAVLVQGFLERSLGQQPGLQAARVCDVLLGVSAGLEVVSKELTKQEVAMRNTRWENWAIAACSGGASTAFRFVNRLAVGEVEQAELPTGQAHVSGGDGPPEEGLSTDLRVIAASHTGTWSRIWKDARHGDGEPEVQWEDELPMWPAMTAKEVADASGDFRKGTSAVDGLHPRQVGLLSKELLEALCELFRGFEAFGRWPASLCSLIVRLLPKDTGGFRTIGLFRTLFRVWAKGRAQGLMRWAAEHLNHPMWNNFGGRRPGDVVWRDLVKASSAGHLGMTAASLQLDISKMFDSIDHRKLAVAARWAKYPLFLLRVFLAAYRWVRTLVLPEGVAGDDIWPTGGVVPGSVAAVVEAALFLLAELLGFCDLWVQQPEIPYQMSISVQVDDFFITVMADSKHVVRIALVEAALDLRQRLEDRLGLPLGRDKSVVSSSDVDLASKLAKDLSSLGAKPEAAVRRLGMKFALAMKGLRDRRLQRSRLGKFARKFGRLKMLSKVKKISGKTLGRMHAALLAGPLFGAEVCPLRQKDLAALRRQAAELRRLGAKSGSQDLLWAIQQAGSDPEAKHWWQVLERYCREVYLACSRWHRPADVVKLPVLRGELQRALDASGNLSDTAFVKLPLHGVVIAAFRAGWTFRSPFCLVTLEHAELDLTTASPVLARGMYLRDYQQQRANLYIASKRADGAVVPDMIDVAVVKSVLVATGKAAFTAQQRVCLTAGFTGGLLTRQRMFTWGLAESDRCLWCGRVDTVRHRLFESGCGPSELQERKARLKLKHHWDLAGGVEDSPNPLWFNKVVVPAAHLPELNMQIRPVTGTAYLDREVLETSYFQHEAAASRLYVDGSALAPTDPFSRAAGAIYQVAEDGSLIRGLSFVVPAGWPQTAAAAEHLAFYVAAAYSAPGLSIVTDCGSVFASATRGPAYAEHPKRPWAAVWASFDSTRLGAVLKVKAHLTEEQSSCRGEGHLWRGNDMADKAAKERALEALPPDLWCKEMTSVLASRKAFLRGAAEVLAEYPRPSLWVDPGLERRVEQATSSHLEVVHGHEVVQLPDKGRWMCVVCSLTCGGSLRETFVRTSCKPLVPVLAGVLAGARASGHQPRVAYIIGSRVPVVCCIGCGCHTEGGSNVIGLARRCVASGPKAMLSKGAQYRLGRFLKGKHPLREATLDGPYELLPTNELWRARVAWPTMLVGSGSVCEDVPDAGSVGHFDNPWAEGPMELEEVDPWPEGPE